MSFQCAQVNAHEKAHSYNGVGKKSLKKYITNQIYCHGVTEYFIFFIIVILQKPNFFMFRMSKRLDFSQVSVLLSAPDLAVLYGKKRYQKHPPFIYRKVGQNDEKLRGLLKTTEYCCILSLCEACWGLSHAARQMEKPQLTIVLFLMFVRKKKKSMCVWGVVYACI